ncbi:FAD/FMN-containing dehydrogenase [Nocardioides terrae]|uniref:FAD/FMN-containing dehydrogenase n=1 Tax=Nocardioides terrae TaxID=574651 RepID=A0A1I1FUM8_9ACTN|nr:FAD-binding oxidoreductase [Nocardioides terrae]SFC02752.1 FAD/FMN-containing dehydrogenase [Nocardioides terrae]
MTGPVPVSGWGRYPVVDAEVHHPRTVDDVAAVVRGGPVTARGLGRSYGDSSLGERIAELTGLDHLVAFDDTTGELTCEAGVSLADVLAVALPRGWFLPVTPGTRFVTVGGAIASDVHGKNHHRDGAFTDHVSSLRVLVASGEVLEVSRASHPDLFHATCGGMGLTGIVLEATFRLRPVRSRAIDETVVKTPSLDGALDAFEEYAGSTYSVGWIDLVATGSSLGRSLVMLGEHAEDGDLGAASARGLPVPVDTPARLLNRFTVAAFNTLYYGRVRRPLVRHRVGYEPFFYPLDRLSDWNRLYGRQGFLQYQFVVPEAAGRDSVAEAVRLIAASGLASPLAVLKVFGEGNASMLGFPRPGYTLTVDLKAGPDALRLCEMLDRLVLEAGGRLYLTKDSRMTSGMFAAGYPRLEEFEQVRSRYGATGVFVSAQARRLGLA